MASRTETHPHINVDTGFSAALEDAVRRQLRFDEEHLALVDGWPGLQLVHFKLGLGVDAGAFHVAADALDKQHL